MKIQIEISEEDFNTLGRDVLWLETWFEFLARQQANETRLLEQLARRSSIRAVLVLNSVSPLDKVTRVKALRDALNLSLMESIQIHDSLAAGNQHEGVFEVDGEAEAAASLDKVGIHMRFTSAT